MATGIKIPFSASPTGGIALVSKDENDRKIIKIAMSDGDNENAFEQDLALGLDMIFDINDPLIRPKIVARIKSMFERFQAQKRFKLLRNTIRWDDENIKEGELRLSFRYLSLESDEEKEYEQVF